LVVGNEQLSNVVMKMEEDEGGHNLTSIPREDEDKLNDMFIHLDEEMKLVEEKVEKILFMKEIPEIENYLFQEEELEYEVCLMEYEYTDNE